MERNLVGRLREQAKADQAELLKAASAAVAALRSYQYGNTAPDLAEEVADALEEAINALEAPIKIARPWPALPTHCACCGAVLMGGATKHADDCEILALIRGHFPGYKEP